MDCFRVNYGLVREICGNLCRWVQYSDRRFPVVFLFLGTLAHAQGAATVFEVASVKVNNSGPEAANGFFPKPGRLRATNTTLQQLIQAAYHINTSQLFGK
jgi:hypothetical protein